MATGWARGGITVSLKINKCFCGNHTLAVMSPRCLESSVGFSWSLQLKDIGKVMQASKTTLSPAYRLGSGPCRERSCALVQRTGPGAWSVSWALYLRALNRRLSSQVNFKLFWFCFWKKWSLLRSHEKLWHFFFFKKITNSNLFFLLSGNVVFTVSWEFQQFQFLGMGLLLVCDSGF